MDNEVMTCTQQEHGSLVPGTPTLPAVISNGMHNDFFRNEWFPGYVFPLAQAINGMHHWQGQIHPIIDGQCLRVDRATSVGYHDSFWTESTWVVGAGPWDQSLNFLLSLPDNARRLIGKVHIMFTPWDEPVDPEEGSLVDSWHWKLAHMLDSDPSEITLDFTECQGAGKAWLAGVFERGILDIPLEMLEGAPTALETGARAHDHMDIRTSI
ncbi:MAG: hypothetical protein Q9169_003109 [Polycauliona sp. 2 TL-2023]